MRKLIAPLAALALLAFAAPALAAPVYDPATQIPPPHPIFTTIGKTPMVELNDGGGGLPYLHADAPYNAGDWEPALAGYVTNGTYDTELQAIDGIAQRWVVRGDRHGRRAHAAHHGRGRDHGGKRKLALVLDIDETSLSNYSAILADNFTFGDHSRAEATDEIGVKIQPTLNLYNLARSKGIAVFFVTGRPEAQRAVTEENLHREGYDGWAGLSLKPPVPAGQTLTTVQYKSGERQKIEDQGYTIVANIGDQYSDLAGGHAARAFKLPNPFYFLP
jgi:hypothetical protein